MKKNGLFVGLVTLDIIYLLNKFPTPNEKVVAGDNILVAGGPAGNSAITFRYLGNNASFLGIVGSHPLSNLIRADLANYGVEVQDLSPKKAAPPPVASIIVTGSDRTVISLNTTKSQATVEQLPTEICSGVDIILIDGHQMAISEIIAQEAKKRKIPVVIDGGSWKVGFEKILPFVDYAICSANFLPPNSQNQADVVSYLSSFDISQIAITHGEKPIVYWAEGKKGEIPVPKISAVDTLGAGDIFHGAFCHYILQQEFSKSLELAARIASFSCQFFGTRQWMQEIRAET